MCCCFLVFEGSKHPFKLNFVRVDGRTVEELRDGGLASRLEGGELVADVGESGSSLSAPGL